MSFAAPENRRVRHIHLVPLRCPDRAPAPSGQRLSDCWPDFSTELAEDRIKAAQQKNRPSAVLKEAVGAILYSVGLVILLMTLAQALRRG